MKTKSEVYEDPEAELLESLKAQKDFLRKDCFGIDGITSETCIKKIEDALTQVEGVHSVKIDPEHHVAVVVYDSRKTNLPSLHDALLKSGYQASRSVS